MTTDRKIKVTLPTYPERVVLHPEAARVIAEHNAAAGGPSAFQAQFEATLEKVIETHYTPEQRAAAIPLADVEQREHDERASEIARLTAENERLTAENERLSEKLRNATAALNWAPRWWSV